MSVYVCWLFLGLSILVASVGLTLLKGLETACPWGGLFSMYGLFIASYYFRSKAVIRIPVAVAYAFWEAVGLAIVIVIGMLVFQEYLGIKQAAGLVLLLAGSYLIHYGTDKGHSRLDEALDKPVPGEPLQHRAKRGPGSGRRGM